MLGTNQRFTAIAAGRCQTATRPLLSCANRLQSCAPSIPCCPSPPQSPAQHPTSCPVPTLDNGSFPTASWFPCRRSASCSDQRTASTRPSTAAPRLKALDTLRRPVGRHFVARHAPHLFCVGFEKDRKQLVAKLVDRPVLKTAHILVRGISSLWHSLPCTSSSG